MAVELPNILGQFLQGQQAGEAQRRKRTLAEFVQPALGGDQAALSKVYGVDPDAGMQLQGMQQKQAAGDREAALADLQQSARLYSSAPPEIKSHLYGKIVDLTEKVGIAPAGSLPRQHDPAMDEGFNKFLAGIAGPADDNTPASIRELQMLQANPQLAELDMKRRTAGFDRPQLIETDGGYAWATPQGATPLDYGSAVGAPSGNYQDQYADIAARNGSAVTSGVRPVLPGVGAGANSQHPKGTAADFRTNGLRPEQVQALMGDLRGQGFEVIDERDNRNGRGPHIHAELPPGGRVMPKAKEKASFTPLTSQEVAQLGLPAGTVAQRNSETNQIDVVSKPDARTGTPGVLPLSAGEAAKVRTQFKETKDALNTFKAFDQALTDVPSGAGLLLDGKQKGRLGTAYNNARAALRIVYNTGVLQPGELPMLESALRDPTSFQAVLDPRTRPQIQAQLDELYRSIATGIENQVASYPQIFDPQKFESFKQSKQGMQAGPKVGDIEDGYRFKGGNKADPNSWEKV